MRTLAAALTVCIVMPIWFYILYKILVAINATELTWFLYWAYLPIALFVTFVTKAIEK